MLGELTGEEEADGSLDLAGAEGGLLVVADEARALRGNLLEDIVDERVHDAHGALGDASLGVDLLEDAVDVDLEGLGPSLLGGGLLGSAGGGAGDGSLSRSSLGHFKVDLVLVIIDQKLVSFKDNLTFDNPIKVPICNLTGQNRLIKDFQIEDSDNDKD